MSNPNAFYPAFEDVACDNCGSSHVKFLFSGTDLLHGLPGQFSVVECAECGWFRQHPRPIAADLAKYYPTDYIPYAKAIEDETRFWKRWDRRYGMIKRRRSIERFAPAGRMLEVGCGTGSFLNEMRQYGWDVVGVEPNAYASDYARTRFGMEIFSGTLEQFDAAPESFDIVASWNVLEHLPTPAQDMRRMGRLLKRGGLLVMGFPSVESLDRKLFGSAWLGWDLPRHLYLFPRASLEAFLAQNGLHVIAIECPAGSYLSFLLSLQMALRKHFRSNWQQVDFVVQIARQFPIRLLAFPFFRLFDALKLSSLLTYYIRKQ